MQLSTPEPVESRAVSGVARVSAVLWLVAGGLVITGLVSAAFAELPQAVEPSANDAWSDFAGWIAASYARAPALVLGIGALIVVPPLALIGILARRREPEGDISQLRTQLQRRPSRKPASEPRDSVRTGHIPLRPVRAWVELVEGPEAAARQRYRLSHTLLRIGRETDNDICIPDKTVHRYHAAVRRTEDAEFVITDLSSAGGNGVVVNGRAVAEARLSNGDMIELGNARLLFSAPV